MVTKILDGIAITATNYQLHARHIWIAALCLGTLLVVFGKGQISGVLLITMMIVFLPAYFIDMAQKDKAKKKVVKK